MLTSRLHSDQKHEDGWDEDEAPAQVKAFDSITHTAASPLLGPEQTRDDSYGDEIEWDVDPLNGSDV
jgi:hypothetical protein